MKIGPGENISLVDDYTVTSGTSDVDTFLFINLGYLLTVGNQYLLRFQCVVDPNNSWQVAPQNDDNQNFSLKNGYNEIVFTAIANRPCWLDDKTRDISHPFTITDAHVEALSADEKITFETSKYVTSLTKNQVASDHTLTAQWTPND